MKNMQMYELIIRETDDGEIEMEQIEFGRHDPNIIRLTEDQVPILIEWLKSILEARILEGG